MDSALAPFRIAAEAALLQLAEIGRPAARLLLAELVEILPGIDPGIVQIVEADPHRVVADRLERQDADLAAPGDDGLLARPMALDLGRRAFDAQILGRQDEPAAVVEIDLEPLLGLL